VSAIIAICNLKGGVGKTTLAVSLACALPGNAAVIDADPQASAAAWASGGRLPVEVIALPLTAEGGRATEVWLSRVLDIGRGASVVVVDLPPALGATTAAALTIAALAVLPATPSAIDLRATRSALGLLRQARQIRGDGMPAALLVPSRVDRRTAAGREIEGALSDMGEPVAPAVAQRAAHADAFGAGEWIGTYAPRSAGHVEIQAVAAVVRRMLARV
jgi:chromosome partitioning protein